MYVKFSEELVLSTIDRDLRVNCMILPNCQNDMLLVKTSAYDIAVLFTRFNSVT